MKILNIFLKMLFKNHNQRRFSYVLSYIFILLLTSATLRQYREMVINPQYFSKHSFQIPNSMVFSSFHCTISSYILHQPRCQQSGAGCNFNIFLRIPYKYQIHIFLKAFVFAHYLLFLGIFIYYARFTFIKICLIMVF